MRASTLCFSVTGTPILASLAKAINIKAMTIRALKSQKYVNKDFIVAQSLRLLAGSSVRLLIWECQINRVLLLL